MKEKIMRWNYKKAFVTLIILAVVLALVSAIAVPLSLSQQIRDARAWEQTAKTEKLQSGERDGEREHDDWEKNITPLSVGHFVLFGSLIVLWLALGAVYWLLVMAWLYKSAVCEGMNKSLWPILGLFCNIFAVFAFLIVRDRPGRVKLEGASAQ